MKSYSRLLQLLQCTGVPVYLCTSVPVYQGGGLYMHSSGQFTCKYFEAPQNSYFQQYIFIQYAHFETEMNKRIF